MMNIHIVYLSVILALVVFQHLERRNLYNRIMSKNLTEYKNNGFHSVQSAHRKALNKWRGREGDR